LLEIGAAARYGLGMNAAVKNILERVAAWPEEDQEELAALAREIEARRTGVYRLSDDEKAAIEAARRSGLASDDGIAAFWKRYGLG
jgi:cell division protein FtsB